MQTVNIKVGQDEMQFETGRMAKQADGAVLATYGGTVVLAAVCAAREAKEGQDFFPLMVDYREKYYAGGKIPGGFFKREARPTEKETLTSRLIDRPIRPLFPEEFLNEVQVSLTVLSIDEKNNPDIVAMIATSLALQISPVPFKKPIAGVRVGLIDGQFVINPTFEQMPETELDLVLAGTEESIVMVEAGASVITEEKMLEAILFGHEEIKKIIAATKDFKSDAPRAAIVAEAKEENPELSKKLDSILKGKFVEINGMTDRDKRHEAKKALTEECLSQFDPEAEDYNEGEIMTYIHDFEYDEVRDLLVNQKKRTDGRAFDEIRDIACETSVLPRTHGSALFTRGQTQSLGVVTLGTKREQPIVDALEGEYKKNFFLHYNFPSFSVGECRPNRGPGRREIGHGALAERALREVIPSQDDFPYTIRVVSEILESNGSSSMASVCSGALAMMDAGVPIKAPVAGIAMGLVTLGDKWEVLTDIAGIEDHLGDMDFKVAGTRDGITALQLDIKIEGINKEIFEKALAEAHKARMAILDKMDSAINAPKSEVSSFAPQIFKLKINPAKIGEVIGPGGKMIRRIQEATGADLDIDDSGEVHISAPNKEGSEKAIQMVKDITSDAEVGRIYDGVVKKILGFGAICEITPAHSGMIHISEIKEGYVEKVEDHLKIGDEVKVKVLAVEREGKIKLSMKAVEAAATE